MSYNNIKQEIKELSKQYKNPGEFISLATKLIALYKRKGLSDDECIERLKEHI